MEPCYNCLLVSGISFVWSFWTLYIDDHVCANRQFYVFFPSVPLCIFYFLFLPYCVSKDFHYDVAKRWWEGNVLSLCLIRVGDAHLFCVWKKKKFREHLLIMSADYWIFKYPWLSVTNRYKVKYCYLWYSSHTYKLIYFSLNW